MYNQIQEFFIKTEDEMKNIHVQQIAPSACGPTALLNVCNLLNYQYDNDKLNNQKFIARKRNYQTHSLYQYLLSRIRAGTIHHDLLEQIKFLTNDDIQGKFFTFDPRTKIQSFKQFIISALKNNCIPILTQNLFYIGNDAWHHQTCYGANQNYIYLTNHLERIPWSQAFMNVSSSSWMIIPEDHISSRYLTHEEIKLISEGEWKNFDILNQIQNIKYFQQTHTSYRGLTIPYGGKAGVTLFYLKENQKIQNIFQTLNEEDQDFYFYPEYNIKVINIQQGQLDNLVSLMDLKYNN